MSHSSRPARLRQWLLQRAEKERENLRLFVLGAAIFFAGMGLIVLAQKWFLPSLQQELVSLLGLVLAVGGGVCAALGYIALSVLRILTVGRRDD
ncbi:hypothetical protein GJQ55_01515 [Venatoribacter cucullus]|uniref:Uncharacterized protein n=1 Tax=Venatoribacter cucullus TaxID=2661630 RepID=A0A9X7UUG7_9GAMM|nr:hypothetical protein [Venatoribacter cucullus]QQD23229.1 hypothetical protein GJQ55_01515 [Venatoribacter cucullus]